MRLKLYISVDNKFVTLYNTVCTNPMIATRKLLLFKNLLCSILRLKTSLLLNV